MRHDPYAALPPVPTFQLTSADVKDGAALSPAQRSGPGRDVSPQLSWSGAPAGTKSYVVTMFDPDAPTPSGFWHWAVMNIAADVRSIERGAVPAGAVHLPNDARVPQYIGAAPPKGTGVHRYFIVVHAVDVETLPLPPEATPAYLSFVLLGHTLGRAMIVATAETP